MFGSRNFGVRIDSGYVKKIDENYVAMEHNSEYTLTLQNYLDTICDANVSIDGRSVGKFRIDPQSSIQIERPASQNRKFVFLRDDSGEADRAGITSNKYMNGVVVVEFIPEKMNFSKVAWKANSVSYSMASNRSVNAARQSSFSNDLSSGATALGDYSSQHFTSVGQISDIDESLRQRIIFRIIVDKKKQQPHGMFPVMDYNDRTRTQHDMWTDYFPDIHMNRPTENEKNEVSF